MVTGGHAYPNAPGMRVIVVGKGHQDHNHDQALYDTYILYTHYHTCNSEHTHTHTHTCVCVTLSADTAAPQRQPSEQAIQAAIEEAASKERVV